LQEIHEYRRYVDDHMLRLLEDLPLDTQRSSVVELGLHHEQQHQELILTDIKHVLSCNPLFPAYREGEISGSGQVAPLGWIDIEEGIHWIGHHGDRFAYDNESPRHRVFLHPSQVADRLVTCGEYLRFMEDDGYRRPEHWLSQGWAQSREHGWEAPLHWVHRDGSWYVFTLAGLKPLDPAQPVCHVSYFEADAYATWADARLPTEFEWEVAAEGRQIQGVFADRLLDERRPVHPLPELAGNAQLLGNVWQWTASPYAAYPGYHTPEGALGEYNGKFMCNQYVLRGGSCATSQSHIRSTYRNFFPLDARWQFSGIRLARSLRTLAAG
jgi:ergothioneine biosynthesis protein EgtB